MIFILIIIITQQKIPHKAGISCSNQNKTVVSIKLERKRKFHSFPSKDSGNLYKYEKMHANTFANMCLYVCTSISPYTNIVIFYNRES